MFAVDISGFGTRDDAVQRHLRSAMYEIVRNACERGGLPWKIVHHEDRGDGILVIAPACVGVETILDSIVPRVRAGQRRHDKVADSAARLRMRMAVHAGYVRFDEDGASGHALVHLFRLLDTAELRATTRTGELGLLVSDHVYDEVVRSESCVSDPASYRRVTVSVKETSADAWLHSPVARIPAEEEPALPAGLTQEDMLVALLLATGWSRAQIARLLGLERACVDRHVVRVIAQLSLATSAWPK